MNIPSIVQLVTARNAFIVLGLIAVNLLFNILANASFRISAGSSTFYHFIAWQVVGNLAGFITVITLTGLLKSIPLSIAFPLTQGLAVIGVQVIAASLIFHEPISFIKWIGTLLIIGGIILIGGK